MDLPRLAGISWKIRWGTFAFDREWADIAVGFRWKTHLLDEKTVLKRSSGLMYSPAGVNPQDQRFRAPMITLRILPLPETPSTIQ